MSKAVAEVQHAAALTSGDGPPTFEMSSRHSSVADGPWARRRSEALRTDAVVFEQVEALRRSRKCHAERVLMRSKEETAAHGKEVGRTAAEAAAWAAAVACTAAESIAGLATIHTEMIARS